MNEQAQIQTMTLESNAKCWPNVFGVDGHRPYEETKILAKLITSARSDGHSQLIWETGTDDEDNINQQLDDLFTVIKSMAVDREQLVTSHVLISPVSDTSKIVRIDVFSTLK